jgi:hypothetical protein
MNINRFLYLLIVIAVLGVTACAPSAESNPVDLFAGTWSGSMGFSDDPGRKQDIVVNIPTGCAVGDICGDTTNPGMSCQWEMTLSAIDQNVFEYKFSKTLSGGDPCNPGVGTRGTLTLQTDGTLMREHKTPMFTASGVLTSMAESTASIASPADAPTSTAEPTKLAIDHVSNFPIGTFVDANDETSEFRFSENGRWAHYNSGLRGAAGTFRVDDDLYIQESNSAGCPVPMSFKYTFDGEFLKFQLTDQSQKDTCNVRWELHNNRTYILAP